eukprot:358164-Chlamydomonas_euryale.AAC.3
MPSLSMLSHASSTRQQAFPCPLTPLDGHTRLSACRPCRVLQVCGARRVHERGERGRRGLSLRGTGGGAHHVPVHRAPPGAAALPHPGGALQRGAGGRRAGLARRARHRRRPN